MKLAKRIAASVAGFIAVGAVMVAAAYFTVCGGAHNPIC